MRRRTTIVVQYLGKNEQSTGDPAATVLVGFTAPYDERGRPVHELRGRAGNPTAEGQPVGQGDVILFTDGKVVRGRWNRPTKEQAAQYVDAAGKPIKLQPGRTWVELLPIGAPVDVTAPPSAPPSS